MGVVLFTLKSGRERLRRPSLNIKKEIAGQEFIQRIECVEDVNML